MPHEKEGTDFCSPFARVMLEQSGARLLLQQSGARLLQASELGDIGLAQACLDEGARANHADAVGHTSLHKCAFMGFNEMALLLLRHDHTLVNVQDMSSSTPLLLGQVTNTLLHYSLNIVPTPTLPTCPGILRCTVPRSKAMRK